MELLPQAAHDETILNIVKRLLMLTVVPVGVLNGGLKTPQVASSMFKATRTRRTQTLSKQGESHPREERHGHQ